jgi:hypothetical protein
MAAWREEMIDMKTAVSTHIGGGPQSRQHDDANPWRTRGAGWDGNQIL